MDKSLFRVLEKYLAGNVTDRERDRVSSWYDDLSDSEAGFKNSLAKKKVKDSLWADIQAKTRKSASAMFNHYRVIAAAVLLIISTTLVCICFKNYTVHNQTIHSTLDTLQSETKNTTLMDSL